MTASLPTTRRLIDSAFKKWENQKNEIQEMKQEKEPMRLSLFKAFKAAILTGLTACSPQPPAQSPTLEVSFRVSATISYVEDVANPERSSGDLIFPNIPDYRTKEPQKYIVVPRSGFFEARCNGGMALKERGAEVDTNGFMDTVSDDGKVMYFFPPDVGNPGRFTLDYNRAFRVDRGQYESNLISRWVITVDGEIVKQQAFTEISIRGGSLGKMIKAVEYPKGLHQVLCIFETRGGKMYQDTATVEIIDNRV